MEISKQDIIRCGLSVLNTEAKAIHDLARSINDDFVAACQLLFTCKGRVIVTGMGKSGHIANKIAATLASTGTAAFYLHPAEASHGDLGMVTKQDVVLILSNSGETNEILTILPQIKRLGAATISITGNAKSQLALLVSVHIDVKVNSEACPLGLAPTASTTASLAMGDALAISLLEARGFTKQNFANSHPGGRLGRRLLIKIKDIMHTINDIPLVTEDAHLSEAIVEMSRKRLGMTIISNSKEAPNNIAGIFTDGDLRRAVDQGLDIHTTQIAQIMTKSFKTIADCALAHEAIPIMETHKIFSLPVVNNNNQLVGAFNMHDLLQAGVI